ncbi:MAG: efflux transporter outer membrane subunit [Betaproteobacteria bacterium]|nr:efflux transporter outer membrane subunit [Betaproteobacteria bacterium]
MKTIRFTISLLALASLSACALGPDYQRPAVVTPKNYGEAVGNWQPAVPKDHMPRGAWWEIYHDDVLDTLEVQVAVNNQNIKVAEAQYQEAKALLDASLAAYWPTIGAKASSNISQYASTQFTAQGANTLDSLSGNASWTIDIWGKLRRTAEANRASAEASQDTLQAALLSAQATLAQSYLQLRVLDDDARMLAQTLVADQRTVDITIHLYHAGVSTPADVALSVSQLKAVEATRVDLGVQRAQLVHAIALLIGQAPALFSLPETNIVPQLPNIPATVPSALLEHRPDIAAAERQMAAANAQIGVAEAAFFPTLTLTGQSGYQGVNFPSLIAAPNQFWSMGPALAGTLFDGGILRAQKAQAVAAYQASVATYRQTVLTGFQEVEDDLASLRILAQEDRVQTEAVAAAQTGLNVALNQYQAGMVSYTNVLTAQTAALSANKARLDVLGRELVASAGLVTALGGNWSAIHP